MENNKMERRWCLVLNGWTKDLGYVNKPLFYFNVEDVYSSMNAYWLRVEENYKGMEGYFANRLQSLVNDIYYNKHICKLEDIVGSKDTRKRFRASGNERQGFKDYTFFLPKDKVVFLEELPESKYEPYENISELILAATQSTGSVSTLTLRDIQSVGKYPIVTDHNDKTLYINNRAISVEKLCSDYQHLDKDGWWQPCGRLVTKRSDGMELEIRDYDEVLETLKHPDWG